jgi:hypothetical protein
MPFLKDLHAIGIFSQTAGPTGTNWANPVNFAFQVEPEVCRRFQVVAQEPKGKADYADIFFEAWMQQLDATEPEYADLSPPTVAQFAPTSRL